jgi:hypothetical protein
MFETLAGIWCVSITPVRTGGIRHGELQVLIADSITFTLFATRAATNSDIATGFLERNLMLASVYHDSR